MTLLCKDTHGIIKKLYKKWTGPYYICHDYGNYSYLLRRCSDNKELRAPVHANRLKHYFDPRNRPTNLPERINDNFDLNPEEIGDAVNQDNNVTQTVDNTQQTQPQQPNHNITNSDNLYTQQNSQADTPNHNNYDQFDVKRILACRKRGNKMEYKIKWLGYTESTWEPKENVSDDLIRLKL